MIQSDRCDMRVDTRRKARRAMSEQIERRRRFVEDVP